MVKDEPRPGPVGPAPAHFSVPARRSSTLLCSRAEMDEAANPRDGGLGGGGDGRGDGVRSAAVAGGASTGPASVVDDDLDELWPSRRPSAAALSLAEVWTQELGGFGGLGRLTGVE